MVNFKHRFVVSASLASVMEYHRRSRSMVDITPPPVFVRIRSSPERLSEGDDMDFTLWLGPLPIHWKARIEQVSNEGFVDRQIKGPFEYWKHNHVFKAVGENQTEVRDEIIFKIRKHLFWGLIGLGMWLSLPLLFAYRAWKTRQILNSLI